jgi:nitric oxide dioxygenase
MLSILNALVSTNPNRPVLFAHAARSQAHIAHFDEIQHTKNLLSNAKLAFFLNEYDGASEDKIKGRMNLSKLEMETYKNGVYYICGPQAFMDDQRDVLLELGINANDIHREVFGPESLNHII